MAFRMRWVCPILLKPEPRQKQTFKTLSKTSEDTIHISVLQRLWCHWKTEFYCLISTVIHGKETVVEREKCVSLIVHVKRPPSHLDGSPFFLKLKHTQAKILFFYFHFCFYSSLTTFLYPTCQQVILRTIIILQLLPHTLMPC